MGLQVVYRIILLITLLCVGVFSFASAASVDPMNLPKLSEYVTDFAGVLPSSDLDALRATAREYETKTTNQMVAVLIPHREGNELFDIGMKVFSANKIGQKGKNNGILLVIATEEKKIRIITGYGLEGDIPDVLASDIIEKSVRPLVNSGKYREAIQAFFDRTTRAIGTDEGAKLQRQNDAEWIRILTLMAIVFGLVFSFNLFFLLFATFFFAVASLSVGSMYPMIAFGLGAAITTAIGFHYFEGFRRTFFEMPKNSGGGGGSGWGSGGSSWGGGFSGGGGSSGGGGAGD